MKAVRTAVILAVATLLFGSAVQGAATPALTSEQATALAHLQMPKPRLASQSIYFVMPDRYANGNTNNDNGAGDYTGGLNKSDIGYFHGGDLVGLKNNLDRIKNMGFTAIWITPVMVQQAVQGSSAAYHGYWGLDFSTVDPHFGDEQDFQDLVDAVHSRGMLLYLDIVVNHTADIIGYAEGNGYTSLSSRPYKDSLGNAFNPSRVMGLNQCATTADTGCFPILNLSSFPKTVSTSGLDRKWPAFLQDPTNYHNRGNVSDWGNSEQVNYGDFVGLDDLFTEKPAVVEGLAQVWSSWITRFGIDGFRIDTARHVDDAFFNKWVPLVYEAAHNAHMTTPDIFGEDVNGDIGAMSGEILTRGLPSMLDFHIDAALSTYLQGGRATDLTSAWSGDYALNRGDDPRGDISNAYGLVTFIGNHDEGRVASKIALGFWNISSTVLAQRVNLAYSILMTSRGAPTVYYGDEVGMRGNGGDKLARQDMFPTAVSMWKSEPRAGSAAIGSKSSLAITSHPIMNQLTKLGVLRAAHQALRDGTQLVRSATVALPAEHGTKCKTETDAKTSKRDNWPMTCIRFNKSKMVWQVDYPKQVAAWSRFDSTTHHEYLVLANTADGPRRATVTTSSPSTKFVGLLGTTGNAYTNAKSVITVTVPARTLLVYRATKPVPAPVAAVAVGVGYIRTGLVGKPEVTASPAATGDPITVTFVYRANAEDSWKSMGAIDTKPYRMVIPPFAWNGANSIEVAAISATTNGLLAVSPGLTVTR